MTLLCDPPPATKPPAPATDLARISSTPEASIISLAALIILLSPTWTSTSLVPSTPCSISAIIAPIAIPPAAPPLLCARALLVDVALILTVSDALKFAAPVVASTTVVISTSARLAAAANKLAEKPTASVSLIWLLAVASKSMLAAVMLALLILALIRLFASLRTKATPTEAPILALMATLVTLIFNSVVSSALTLSLPPTSAAPLPFTLASTVLSILL
ncbi:MAG: hypothetical protein OFPI_13330 [Osedax symbiont Rs2]|nr:MAG: hypothetical protein OFPI_13330 [Osedax symbiont Rs2]